MRCLVTFETATGALLFERSCRKEGILAQVVPVPRKISPSCGIACEVPCEDLDEAQTLINLKKIPGTAFHQIEDGWT